MATLQELLEQRQALDAQIKQQQTAQRTDALAQIRELMEAHGLTAADLIAAPSPGKKKGALAGTKVAAKYRHSESGATWSGRGIKPKWLAEELSKGRQLTDFAV